jgi:hypothetical protein
MYYQVATKLVVLNGTAYTQAVSMEGANAILAEYANFGGGSGSIVAEIGNDLENWGTFGTQGSFGGGTYGTFFAQNIPARYVRLRFMSAAANNLLIGAGINTTQL